MIAIELDWIEAPDSGDLLLAKTWARLSLRYADVALTRVFDRSSRTEREAIHVPLYPLARWVVDQWWPLLYEPLAADFKLPEPGADANRSNETIRAWLSKHCFRVAIPGYAFPYLCVFSNGPDLMLVTKADPHGRYRHTAAEFCENRIGPASRETMKQELARLVEGVLSRLEAVKEPRVEALRSDWQAICAATAEESEFCRSAGRLGLDPYGDELPSEVLRWFEMAKPGELEGSVVKDLLEAPGPIELKPSQNNRLTQLVAKHRLQPAPGVFGPVPKSVPYLDGYRLAHWLRQELGLQDDQPIKDFQAAAEASCGYALRYAKEPEMGKLGQILRLVGWTEGGEPLVAGGPGGRPETERFLLARALHVALRATAPGPRLVTDAKTAEQQASRAFGAELLAPRQGVLALYKTKAPKLGHDEAIAQLARHFGFSSVGIHQQLENAAGI